MRRPRFSKSSTIALPVFTGVGILILLEVAVHFGLIANYILPAPSDVFLALVQDSSDLWFGFVSTAVSAIAGWGISFFLGSVVAVFLAFSETARRAFMPYAIFFQTVPVIALAPVLVIWLGFGRPTVIASAFIVSLFPVIANTLLGFQSTDAMLVELFHFFGARPIAVFLKLRLPASLPLIFAGMRIAAGLAVIGAVVGEFIAGGGLGEVIDAARTQQRLDRVFAAVILSSLLGLAMVSLVNAIAWLALHAWHESEAESRRSP